MRLIGMLDSPYVRRVAVSMKLMGLGFDHESVSVFRHFDQFASINPIVKAPSLVTGDGVVLMDSTLILDYVERLAEPERRLTPMDLAQHLRSQRIIGLALAACEKTVQIVYEFNTRPSEKQHEPWLDRVKGQLSAAYGLLEAEIADPQAWLIGERPMQADVTTAVAWRFTQFTHPQLATPATYPKLAAFSARAEALPEFVSTPLE
ncbi:MAG TPA: glutathione S-transferase [Caulobacteraceae bacterium]